MKVSEKQELTKKLVSKLEKRFGRPPETPDRTVLESMLYAVCLENDSYAAADQAYAALHEKFHDLNEVRVSTISELKAAFAHQSEPQLRAHRVRTVLQFVFEDHFEFDLESIRKKTQEQAAKKLGKVQDLTPFIRNHVQQVALAAHLVPMDDRMTAAAVWLGLLEPGTSTEAAADGLKAAVRKADAPLFCHLLRSLAAEPPGRGLFDPASFSVPEDGYAASSAMERLDDLLAGRTRTAAKAKPKPEKKSAKAAKAPAAKPAAKKTKPPAASAKRPGADKKPKGRSRAVS